MADSSRNLHDYTRAVESTSQLAGKVLGELFARYGGGSADDLRDALLLGVPGVVERFGEISVEAALEYYERERSQVTDSYYWQSHRVRVSVGEIERVLRYHTGKLYEGDTAGFRQAVEAEVDRWVKLAARRAIIATSESDKACTGWARIPTGAKTCAFCFMLASRGFAYKSAKSAGLERKFHTKCDCRVVPEFLGKTPSIKGYDPEKMYAVYKQSHRKGDKASDVLYRMRRKHPDLFTDGVGSGKSSGNTGKNEKTGDKYEPVGKWPGGIPQRLGGVRPFPTLAQTPRIKGDTSFAARVDKVNPHYGETSQWPEVWGAEHPYNVNCVRCSVTLILQHLGYHVEAGAGGYRPVSGGWNSAEMLSHWVSEDGRPVEFIAMPTGKNRGTISNKRTLALLQREPVGSYGVVRASWSRNRGSHIWNYEVTKDRGVVFWDAQPGKEVSIEAYYSEFKRGSFMFARLDNALPSDELLEIVSIPEPERRKNDYV